VIDPRPIVVALCADKNMEAGLHVTLYSFLANESVRERGARIHLFTEGFSDSDLALLRSTADRAETKYELFSKSIDLDRFQKFQPLHGSHMAYARLSLPEILRDEERLVYFDSDLLVGATVDLSSLFDTDLHGQPLGAVAAASVEWSMEREFLLGQGLRKNDPYLNSGVLLFDCKNWRENHWTAKCLEFCRAHRNQLGTADQTVLNVMLRNRFLPLNAGFNHPLYAISPLATEAETRSRLIHFVGAPKPWDLFGNFSHRNYSLFRSCFRNTALGNSGPNVSSAVTRLRRSFRLRRSYLRCWTHQLKSLTAHAP
jgi:lipopolysaccharide biosynthesis glycosyltransferase